MKLEPSFLALAACPRCGSSLREIAPGTTKHEVACSSKGCGLTYPVRDNIPVLLVDEARQPV